MSNIAPLFDGGLKLLTTGAASPYVLRRFSSDSLQLLRTVRIGVAHLEACRLRREVRFATCNVNPDKAGIRSHEPRLIIGSGSNIHLHQCGTISNCTLQVQIKWNVSQPSKRVSVVSQLELLLCRNNWLLRPSTIVMQRTIGQISEVDFACHFWLYSLVRQEAV